MSATTEQSMKIKAIAPWFGGKRTLAPRIVAELGEHDQFFDPMCGGMAVIFAKPPSRQETVNDLHGGVTTLARVLADPIAAPALYERCQRTLFCEGLLEDARAFLGPVAEPVDQDPAEFAYWYMVASWIPRNGTAGTSVENYQIAVRWTRNGGSPTVRWRSAVDSIPAWHDRLRNVVILNKDALAITPRFEDHERTAIYVDPPYPKESRSCAQRQSKGHEGRYLHEFEHGAGGMFDQERDDHATIAEILRKFQRARIVVSSYDCDRVRELYDGWTFVPCPMKKSLAAQNKRDSRNRVEAPEVLIINGPSYTEAKS